jgi:mannose-6-phosphate isomerase-like protein (cupin superfamily)
MMTVDFQTLEQCHVVHKPWGTETWLQGGSDVYPFALKELILKAGFVTSLQVHQHKSESIHLHIGKGALAYYPKPFDCERYLAGGYSAEEIAQIKTELIVQELEPGAVFHTPPGTIHRMIAHEDLHYTEASTTQLDDVIRLEDSANRGHGRIDAEHQQ